MHRLLIRVKVQVKTVSADETYIFGYFLPDLLNKCLGDADYDPNNNSDDPINWDWGSIYYPHLVKSVPSPLLSFACLFPPPAPAPAPAPVRLVRRVDDYRDGGFLVVLYYDPTIKDFDTASGFVSNLGVVKGARPDDDSIGCT